MTNQMQGTLIIVSAPSGGGKTSLIKNIVSDLDNIEVSISHTTRKRRANEKEGQDYFFINKKVFLQMIAKQSFIEYATVFGHYYGTSIEQIKERLVRGVDVLLDIDWQGAEQIKRLFPDALSIFILPPSLLVLKQRLIERRQDEEHIVIYRMQQASQELSHYHQFDYLIVNDEFEQAVQELKAIIIANRLSLPRQAKRLSKLLSFLLTSE